MDTRHLPMEEDHGEAERWFMRLQMPDCSPADRAAFARWRLASPSNAAAYAQVEQIFQHSALAAGDPRLQAASRAARVRLAHDRKPRRLRWAIPLASAALLLLAVGIGWRWWDTPQPVQHYATAVGEQRSLTLDDGSRVLLDTDSSLAVRYSRRQRELLMERGQAQFTVVSQRQRPFVVKAGTGTVHAVGTRFQVRRGEEMIQVTLLEGVVEVRDAADANGKARVTRLAPGEQMDFGGQLWRKRSIDLDVANGWTQGQLVFRRRPLQEVVDEMNRYSAVKIRLGDPSLQTLQISGQFYGKDQASLIQALELGWSLHAERTTADRIILSRD